MSNIYLGFNQHGFPIRISRELACKAYKEATGLDDKRVNEIMDHQDNAGAMYVDDDFKPFLVVCDEAIQDEKAIYIGNTPIRATELPV